MPRQLPLTFILLAYLFIAVLYAVFTPAWQAPDEPAHYNYVRQLAAGELPVIEPEDYDEAYRREIVSSAFASGYSIDPLTYEDWQPPLYYLLLTPVYILFDGALLPLRFTSLLLGAGVIVATYGATSRLWPRRHWLALSATVFVALLPQHVAMLAAVNNDSLAELLIALILWRLLITTVERAGRTGVGSGRPWIILGLFLGLGFLTKATVYIMAPVILFALIWLYRADWSTLLRAGVAVFLPAVLLGSLWWVRNLVVYGGFDLMGKKAHDAIVVGQLRTETWLSQQEPLTAASSFLQTTFQSFWGQFGWMGVVMPTWIYQFLLLFTLFVLAGLVWTFLRRPGGTASSDLHADRLPAALLGATFVLSLLVYVGYNLTFVQHQGRYLFPSLVPIGAAVALGLGAWVRPLVRQNKRLGLLVPALLALALLSLDLLALFNFIIPQLS